MTICAGKASDAKEQRREARRAYQRAYQRTYYQNNPEQRAKRAYRKRCRRAGLSREAVAAEIARGGFA